MPPTRAGASGIGQGWCAQRPTANCSAFTSALIASILTEWYRWVKAFDGPAQGISEAALLNTDTAPVSDVVITVGLAAAGPILPGSRQATRTGETRRPAGQGIDAVRPIREGTTARVQGLIGELLPVPELPCGLLASPPAGSRGCRGSVGYPKRPDSSSGCASPGQRLHPAQQTSLLEREDLYARAQTRSHRPRPTTSDLQRPTVAFTRCSPESGEETSSDQDDPAAAHRHTA